MPRRTVSDYLGVPAAGAAKAPGRALVPTGRLPPRRTARPRSRRS